MIRKCHFVSVYDSYPSYQSSTSTSDHSNQRLVGHYMQSLSLQTKPLSLKKNHERGFQDYTSHVIFDKPKHGAIVPYKFDQVTRIEAFSLMSIYSH